MMNCPEAIDIDDIEIIELALMEEPHERVHVSLPG